MKNIFFNAQHSPIGSYSSLTLGFPGAKGGMGIELDKPANMDVYVGLEAADGKSFEVLPFADFSLDDVKRLDLERIRTNPEEIKQVVEFDKKSINREFTTCTDRWKAGDLDVCIYSQVCELPDPLNSTNENLKKVYVPAVLVEYTIDNTKSSIDRRAFFGFDGTDPSYGLRQIHEENPQIDGVTLADRIAIIGKRGEVSSAKGFSMESILNEGIKENLKCGFGHIAAILMNVPAGQKKTFSIAVCFYLSGYVTTGIKTKYLYTSLFKDIEEVGEFALKNAEDFKSTCKVMDDKINSANLSENQKFMLNHAIKSYYGSSQLLEDSGKPIWIINEGEYRIMNTLDLAVDQLFYEIKLSPWTVKNELDLILDRYSYYDKVKFPDQDEEYPGGLTFTHDIGEYNVFARPQYSAYEREGLDGCFSYMSHEQLVNWLCCALVYIENSNDKEWLNNRLDKIVECFKSMLNRDNPDPAKRNGIMSLDSCRCGGGAEITTYDALEISLGQARNNVYMAGKCWAVYVSLEKIFKEQKMDDLATSAGNQAKLCSDSIVSHMSDKGYIPAVMEKNNDSKIIPVIEGLVFPYFTGCKEALDPEGRFGNYIKALKTHFENVLVKGVCLFDNGGWRLSSTSDNTWLSKIYLNQFIARKILGIDNNTCKKAADEIHVEWLLHPEHSYWCWSDQIIDGEVIGSKYYPRGVTSILWLDE